MTSRSMLSSAFLVVFFGVCGVTDLAAQTSFESVFPTGALITGVRQEDGNGNVLITGINAGNLAFIYSGPLNPLPSLTPPGLPTNPPPFYTFPSTSLPSSWNATSSAFYGPNTSYYNSDNIPVGNVEAVGQHGTSTYTHGMLYNGPLTGGTSAAWTMLSVPNSVASGMVGDTLAHSVMGAVVVGNYNLQGAGGLASVVADITDPTNIKYFSSPRPLTVLPQSMACGRTTAKGVTAIPWWVVLPHLVDSSRGSS